MLGSLVRILALLMILLCQGAWAGEGSRILVVAPHPDDEILGAGSVLYQAGRAMARGEKIDVRVVIVTCGDGYTQAFDRWFRSRDAQDWNGDGRIDYVDFGWARHQESLDALKMLGIPAEKVVFLGYPDGGLGELAAGKVYHHPHTQVAQVPYSFARRPGAAYSKAEAVKDLREVIETFHPSEVYSPTLTDEHPDHAQTGFFTHEALAQVAGQTVHWEYLVHWESHVKGWPERTLLWKAPPGHLSPDRQVLLKDAGWSRERKAALIRVYRTQTRVMPPYYLMSFAKKDEVFWRARQRVSDYLSSAGK